MANYERDITKPHKQSVQFSVDEETFVLFVYMANGDYNAFKKLMWTTPFTHRKFYCPPYHLMPRRTKDEMMCFYCYECYHHAYHRVKINHHKKVVHIKGSSMEYKFEYLENLKIEYLKRSDEIEESIQQAIQNKSK